MNDLLQYLEHSNPKNWAEFIEGKRVFFPVNLHGVDGGIFRSDGDLWLFRCPNSLDEELVQELSQKMARELKDVRKHIEDASLKKLQEGDEHKGLVVEH